MRSSPSTPSSSSRTTCSRPPGSATARPSSPCSATRKATPARASSSNTAGPSRSSKTLKTAAPRPTSPARWADPVNGRGPGAGWLYDQAAAGALPGGCTGFRAGLRLRHAESQPREQQDQRHHETADAVRDERGKALDVVDQPAEVLAEEAGDKGQWQEDRREHRQLLDGGVLPDADPGLLDREDRHVGLQHRAEEVTLRGNLLLHKEQVVLDVAQVWPQLPGQGGALDRGDHGEQRVDGAVEVGRLVAQRVDPLGGRDAAGEHRGLDLVDVALEPANDGRVVVNDLVEDRPERG